MGMYDGIPPHNSAPVCSQYSSTRTALEPGWMESDREDDDVVQVMV